MVSELASRIRDREFKSHDKHFPQNQIIFFYFLVFPFIFLNFEVKQCANIYWKYDNTGFAMEKKQFFLFFKMVNTSHKGKTRHIAWSSSFLFKAQCFYRDENDLAPDDKYYIWKTFFTIFGKRNALWFWQHFTENNNSSCFWYTNSFNWKSNIVLIYYKSEDGYPIFYFLIFFW